MTEPIQNPWRFAEISEPRGLHVPKPCAVQRRSAPLRPTGARPTGLCAAALRLAVLGLAALCVAGLWAAGRADLAIADSQGSSNPASHDAPAQLEAPPGWSTASPRPEMSPRFWVERPESPETSPKTVADAVPGPGAEPGSGSATDLGPFGLAMAGAGSESVDGRWIHTQDVAGEKCYAFFARAHTKAVAEPERSILARIVWLDAKGAQVEQPDYPPSRPVQGSRDSWILEGAYRAPARAARAQIELHLRWTPDGQVIWWGPSLREARAPPPRKVRLASVNHRPRGGTPMANVERFAALVGEAARQKADAVCLPEGITVVGTGKSYADVAEPVPGPSTEALSKAAAQHGIHVFAGLYEREGAAIHNTCIVLGRDGKLIGKYRKVCIPREEIDGGIAPGDEYPVFDLDFGRVGMMICWDVHFPEVARELGRKGAEVIFLPIWGGNKTLAQARAIENQIFLVTSGYDFETSIFDRTGLEMAKAERDPEVIVVEVDLNERQLWPWLGDWRSRIWREAPSRR